MTLHCSFCDRTLLFVFDPLSSKDLSEQVEEFLENNQWYGDNDGEPEWYDCRLCYNEDESQ